MLKPVCPIGGESNAVLSVCVRKLSSVPRRAADAWWIFLDTYRVLITSVPYAAEVVTRMYGGRADSENRIKELKEDLSLDTFCLKSFDATDAAFRMGCVLYNLLADFRETLLPRAWFERRLRALRDCVLSSGRT